MSKQERANEIFTNFGGNGSRQHVMAEIRHQTGASQAYASTLYNNARKSANVLSNDALSRYIDAANAWGKLFPKTHKQIEYPSNFQECKPLFGKLAGDLSPENLCCDGELPHAQVQIKARHLHECWAILEEISHKRVTEEMCWKW